jgi:hypothetical protein
VNDGIRGGADGGGASRRRSIHDMHGGCV